MAFLSFFQKSCFLFFYNTLCDFITSMDPSLALKKEKMDFLGMPKIKLIVWPLSFQDNKIFFCSTKTAIYWPQYIFKNRKLIGRKRSFWLAMNWLKNKFFPKMDQEIDRSKIFEFRSKDLLKLLQLSNFQQNWSKNGFSRPNFLFWPILAPKCFFCPYLRFGLTDFKNIWDLKFPW